MIWNPNFGCKVIHFVVENDAVVLTATMPTKIAVDTINLPTAARQPGGGDGYLHYWTLRKGQTVVYGG